MAKLCMQPDSTTMVPKHMVPSKNCFTMPCRNSHTFGPGHVYRAGDVVICDCDRVPKRGDVVVMMKEGKMPVARRCDIPPVAAKGGRWAFGHEHEGETFLFRSDDFDLVGVITGIVPQAEPRA